MLDDTEMNLPDLQNHPQTMFDAIQIGKGE
jgi:hypothetical protein